MIFSEEKVSVSVVICCHVSGVEYRAGCGRGSGRSFGAASGKRRQHSGTYVVYVHTQTRSIHGDHHKDKFSKNSTFLLLCKT